MGHPTRVNFIANLPFGERKLYCQLSSAERLEIARNPERYELSRDGNYIGKRRHKIARSGYGYQNNFNSNERRF